MYKKNKYLKLYNKIISNARKRRNIVGYKEKHHVLPTSLGGTNYKINLVYLTAREHFICHILLTKCLKTEVNIGKMLHAVMLFKGNNKNQFRIVNSRLFESAREKFSLYIKEHLSGRVLSETHKDNISKSLKSKNLKRTEETKLKLSISAKARIRKPHSEETKIKLSNAAKGVKRPCSEETKLKLSNLAKERYAKAVD